MNVVALAGGIGAGKFLRGLVRVLSPERLTVVVNTGDDLVLHGLRISPDLDSVMYRLAGVADRDRGWGRAGESFRTLEEVRRLGGRAWFSLGDLDLATHLVRTDLLASGATLSEATAELCRAFGVSPRVVPMSDDPVATRLDVVDEGGRAMDLHFQEYWVARGARDQVKAVRFEGAEGARPASGVIEAIHAADAVLICPSNPVVSVGPILAVPGIAGAVALRPVVGVSPIVGGAPVAGMADRLMPAVGLEVSAAGAARAYRDLLDGWVLDRRDRDLGPSIERELGVRTVAVDTLMTDDDVAEDVARVAVELATG